MGIQAGLWATLWAGLMPSWAVVSPLRQGVSCQGPATSHQSWSAGGDHHTDSNGPSPGPTGPPSQDFSPPEPAVPTMGGPSPQVWLYKVWQTEKSRQAPSPPWSSPQVPSPWAPSPAWEKQI